MRAPLLSILSHYELGRVRSVRALATGCQSDNFRVESDAGRFVLKRLAVRGADPELVMELLRRLLARGAPVPPPVRTREGRWSVIDEVGHSWVLNGFLRGRPLAGRREDARLERIGREVGRLHGALVDASAADPEPLRRIGPSPEQVLRQWFEPWRGAERRVAAAYARFREELEGLPPPTQAALHGDLGPGCFLFQGEEVSGILDFGAASYWYLLYDVASCVMYVRGYWPERAPHCRRLLSGYASAAPIDGGELRFLPLFVRCRALVQVGYFDMRVREGITQGNDLTANRRGLANGIRMLELAERLPPEHFATRARTSHRRVRAVRESRTRRTSR